MSTTSPLVESLLSGDRIGVGGILCNDPNGLCLVSKGNMVASDHSNNNNNGCSGGNVISSNDDKSGVFTSLVRLSYQLQELQQQHPSLNNESTPHNSSSPLITIETDTSAILVKEYDGHAVAMRVPRTGPQNEKS